MLLRIKELRNQKKMSLRALAEASGVSPRMISAYENENSEPTISKLIAICKVLECSLKDILAEPVSDNIMPNLHETAAIYETRSGAPYYDSPVTAGGRANFNREKIKGKIDLPGIKAVAYFPVEGTSMQPTIMNGDIIGVDEVQNWENLDPDKVYYIVTTEDRMIKHLRHDQNDPLRLVCISPNYREFTIDIEDVKYIYKVTFIGRRP